MKNVYADPAHAETVKRLKAEMEALKKELEGQGSVRERAAGRRRRLMRAAAALLLVAASLAVAAANQAIDRAVVGERFRTLTRESAWTPVAQVPLKFTTHHPQGMIKLGDTLFLSSVEIKVRTTRFASPKDGYDRDAGAGVGHLFKVDLRPGSAGGLLASTTLGEGTMYHPGGLDFDGTSLWVPVAEYRPNSRSLVYKVDPQTLAAAVALRFPDHIGGVVRNTDDGTLHGVSWGSRRFYKWALDPAGAITNAAADPLRSGRSTPRTTSTTRTASMPAAAPCSAAASASSGRPARPYSGLAAWI